MTLPRSSSSSLVSSVVSDEPEVEGESHAIRRAGRRLDTAKHEFVYKADQLITNEAWDLLYGSESPGSEVVEGHAISPVQISTAENPYFVCLHAQYKAPGRDDRAHFRPFRYHISVEELAISFTSSSLFPSSFISFSFSLPWVGFTAGITILLLVVLLLVSLRWWSREVGGTRGLGNEENNRGNRVQKARARRRQSGGRSILDICHDAAVKLVNWLVRE